MLLFSYKPVDNKLIWLPLRETFEELFYQTFSRKKNQTFLGHIQTCYRQKRWRDLLKLMQHIHKSAINKEVKENASGKSSDWSNIISGELLQSRWFFCFSFLCLYYFLLVSKNAISVYSKTLKILFEYFFLSNLSLLLAMSESEGLFVWPMVPLISQLHSAHMCLLCWWAVLVFCVAVFHLYALIICSP